MALPPLPTSASPEATKSMDQLLAQAADVDFLLQIGRAAITREAPYDTHILTRVIDRAHELGLLAAWFAAVIEARLYDLHLAPPARDGFDDSPQRRALAGARPAYDKEALNAPALALYKSGRSGGPYPFDVLIVPGYTPLDTPADLQLT